MYTYYAALLPRRGPHYASHSVCPSVCLSVRPVIVATGPAVVAKQHRLYRPQRGTDGRISYGHLGRTDSCFYLLYLWCCNCSSQHLHYNSIHRCKVVTKINGHMIMWMWLRMSARDRVRLNVDSEQGRGGWFLSILCIIDVPMRRHELNTCCGKWSVSLIQCPTCCWRFARCSLRVWLYWCTCVFWGPLHIPKTQQHHSVARQCVHCCKGDAASQWERAIWGCFCNPWTDWLKISHTGLRCWVDLVCQIS